MNTVSGVRKATWLWWLALFIVILGGLVVYLMKQQSTLTHELAEQTNFIIAVTALAAGVCIISASADWWMRH
jgi:uncharacterized Tic20 family protein